MKQILLSALAAAVTFVASAGVINVKAPASQPKPATASAITFKEKYHIDEFTPLKKTDVNRLKAPETGNTLPDDSLIIAPQGIASRYAMSVDIYLSHLGSTHVGGFGAKAFVSDDGSTFYSKAFTLNFFQQGFSEGKIEGDSIVFHSGQYIYNTDDNQKAYMYAAYLYEDGTWPEVVDTFVLTKDEKGRYVSKPNYYFFVMTAEEAEGGINENTDIKCFGFNYVFTPLPENVVEDTMPADAEVFDCQFFANSLSNYGETMMKDIKVGVSGDKIYVGGLTDYLPDCYLVGTKSSANTYTFCSHQYIGYYDEGDYPYIYEFAMVNPIYFNSDEESLGYLETDSVTMSINDTHTLLTIEEEAGIFNCAYGDLTSWNEVYWNMMIGNFNQKLTPKAPAGVECYGSYGAPYIVFEWDTNSVEGLPLNTENLWCEITLNGETYTFQPEYYEGLAEATDKIPYSLSGVDGLYPGSYATLNFNEYEDRFSDIKTLGVRIGYKSESDTTYTEVVYAKGKEPIEDKAAVPSAPTKVVYTKDYYSQIHFTFDGKDTEGNPIPERLLGVEVMLDGEPLVFSNSDYYFDNSTGEEATVIGLAEYSQNYSTSLVSHFNGKYVLSLWGHSELPEFQRLAVRTVCTGGGTVTYGEPCEIELKRAATPAKPWEVTYDADSRTLEFGALPVDTEGHGLSPWNYGYEVFVNDSLYTFNGTLYELENDITLIPYLGFEYNYSFYLHTNTIYDETDWSVMDQKPVMSVSMLEEGLDIQKIGVRAVYTDGEGNTTYSEIVNNDGSESAISAVTADDAPVKWYNLQGIEVANPESGAIYLRRQGSTVTKVYVK